MKINKVVKYEFNGTLYDTEEDAIKASQTKYVMFDGEGYIVDYSKYATFVYLHNREEAKRFTKEHNEEGGIPTTVEWRGKGIYTYCYINLYNTKYILVYDGIKKVVNWLAENCDKFGNIVNNGKKEDYRDSDYYDE